MGGCGGWRRSIPIRRIDEVLAEQRKIRKGGRRIAGHHQLQAPGLLTAVNGHGVCDATIEGPTLCALNPTEYTACLWALSSPWHVALLNRPREPCEVPAMVLRWCVNVNGVSVLYPWLFQTHD